MYFIITGFLSSRCRLLQSRFHYFKPQVLLFQPQSLYYRYVLPYLVWCIAEWIDKVIELGHNFNFKYYCLLAGSPKADEDKNWSGRVFCIIYRGDNKTEEWYEEKEKAVSTSWTNPAVMLKVYDFIQITHRKCWESWWSYICNCFNNWRC